MQELRKILVALKPGGPGLPLAATHARFLAERLDAELTLVSTVFDSAVGLALTQADAGAFAAQAGLMRAEQERLESIAGSMRDWGARVRTEVVWHQPAYEGILHAVERLGGDMLVVGMHDSALGLRMAETEWQLMRLCPCPLLVVKDTRFQDYRVMLAAVDPMHRHAEPEGLDRELIGAATLLRDAFGAQLRVVHAYPDPAGFALASSVQVLPGVYYSADNIAAAHRQAVYDLVAPFGLGRADVELLPGKPAEVIAEAVTAVGAKLLILGAVKRGRLEQAVLGSTAEEVAAEVPCDLLLVKAPPRP
jgi:universal stress protein E